MTLNLTLIAAAHVDLGDHILVTKQVADEVSRNKLLVFLKNAGTMSPGFPPNIPDHFIRTRASAALKNELKALEESHKATAKRWKEEMDGLAYEIANNTDPATTMLKPLMKRARSATGDQLEAARLRRELGNPPGKKGDPLGDQLSWQQFLDAVEGEKLAWVITRDSDLAVLSGKKRVLNPYLHRELTERGVEQVFVFDNLAGAMKSLRAEGVDVAGRLKENELDELEKEEQRAHVPSPPYAIWPSGPWTCPSCNNANNESMLSAHPSQYGGWSYWVSCSHCGYRFDTGEAYDD